MNSWHSFSPNGRWLVFSSKSRSPYTQMLLTHLDEQGNDTPAILIENSTAANRAVNLPEFLNIPMDGLQKIDARAAAHFRLLDLASEAMHAGRHEQAIPLLETALAQDADDPAVHNSLGSALAAEGRLTEAVTRYRTAVRLSPDYPDAHANLAAALYESGHPREAVAEFRTALSLKPDFPEAHAGLGGLLAQTGKVEEAISHLREAVRKMPEDPGVRTNLSLALAMVGRLEEAIPHAQAAVALSNGRDPLRLGLLGQIQARAGHLTEAAEAARQALAVAVQLGDERLAGQLRAELQSYESANARGQRR